MGKSLDTVRKQIAVEAYTEISERTPVDTGRARGNWQIGIGQDPTDELERTGNATSEEVVKLDRLKGDETIYISNNLPYINKLEYGSSKQAPNGMVGITMSHINNQIEKVVKEIERR